ncbi:response regulator [Paraburkholderia acidiphila]|uniref:Response regulator n=1 Tax=Paraburkholderia acidiphila TaxID=2571747 RepID=A0A7Z2G9W0_9BURK|nr:response regulator [Paraburkholderia acidiphila]QGZ57730.1 response regulator [Paraburkholderia acidiphila]
MNNNLPCLRSEGCTHVIDSEHSARIAVAKQLRRAGYQVRHYASISEFLMRDAIDEFGCILTEVQFSDGPDWFALLQDLSRSSNSLPVVLMSASDDVATAVKAMKLGDGLFE